MEKGSILVLTLISVMVLSLLITGLMTVGTTEMYTTQNYHLNRISHYYALEALEIVKSDIQTTEDPPSILLDSEPVEANGISKTCYLGSLVHLQENETKTIDLFKGFPAPPLTGMSLGSNSNIQSVVWEVLITSEVSQGTKKTYTELISGVYSIMKEY